jgi:GTP:adenosylcobinamide-phosphate guanylyltransferase
MSWTAVLLAGSRPGRDAFATEFGTDLKALIPVGGEPMVRQPARALLQSENIASVIVVSQQPERIAEVLPQDPRIAVRSSQGSIAETMFELCEEPTLQWPLFVTTGDHALLESATIDEFLSASVGSDLAIGVVERTNMLRRFPGAKRTWLKFRAGAFTGANLFALGSPKVADAIRLWSGGEQGRKKGWRLISLFGPAILAGVGLRLLSIDEVASRVGKKLGLNVKIVRLSNPLAGIDVDKMADHQLAEAILEGRA